MIVGSHDIGRRFLTKVFSDQGYQVLDATDGTEALKIAQNSPPALIVSDILLPGSDGIQLARELRLLPGHKETPIILYTAACRHKGKLSLGDGLGSCMILPKPTDSNDILVAARKLLAEKGSGPSTIVYPVYTPNYNGWGAFIKGTTMQPTTLAEWSYNLISQNDSQKLLESASRAAGEYFGSSSLIAINGENGSKALYWSQGEKCKEYPLELEAVEEQTLEGGWGPVVWGPMADSRGFGMAIPFSTPGQVYGCHYIWSEDRPSPFADEEQEMLVNLSAYTALAYENILLQEMLIDREERQEELIAEKALKLKEAGKELRNAQNSMGILAGGTAHHLNNALAVILSHVQAAKILSDYGGTQVKDLQMAEEACFAALELAKKLSAFSNGDKPSKRITALGPFLRDTVQSALEDFEVEAEFQLAPDLAAVEIDRCQIKQVIADLILNAQQAMSVKSVVGIRAHNVEIGPSSALPLAPGPYVCFSVKDAGRGIPPENLEKIFDPFYTDKKTGTGLGLATALIIARGHGGAITVESTRGKGTTFTVYLPAAKGKSFLKEGAKETEDTKRGVLIIVDNRVVAMTLTELLSAHGYRVEWSRDGLNGVKRYKRRLLRKKFDAVLIDLIIPGGIGGKETVNLLKKVDPGVKAAVVSGHIHDPVMVNFRRYGFKAAFPKPFAIDSLVRGIEQLIIENC